MMPVVHCSNESKKEFDNLDLGKSQKEKMAALLSEYKRLKALEDNLNQSEQTDSYLAKKSQTTEEFLDGIDDENLFNKNGTYTKNGVTKSLKGYPGLIKLRVKRLYETLLAINESLEPDEWVKINWWQINLYLRTNIQSVKKAWEELGCEETETYRKTSYTWRELIKLEKENFPNSKHYIFELLTR